MKITLIWSYRLGGTCGQGTCVFRMLRSKLMVGILKQNLHVVRKELDTVRPLTACFTGSFFPLLSLSSTFTPTYSFLDLSRFIAALTYAKCENACGVFPSCSPDTAISSLNKPK
jgi:hypothetical protein